jgi:hypothetical protein
MIKNLTSHQLLLFGLAGVVLLIAAVSFYLLQDPLAPLPFAPPPATGTPTPLSPSETSLSTATDTPVPTRQTSYTPFASTYTPTSGFPSPVMPTTTTPIPSTTITPSQTPPTELITPSPTSTLSRTLTPTLTATLSLGETGVTGRVLQNGIPVAGAVVLFQDDASERQSTTNPGGHYWFTTLAPGTSFLMTFLQSDNPQLTPATEISPLAWIEGSLPTSVNPINLPDFDISLNQNAILFALQSPTDGTTYFASVISYANPIQFIWSPYGLGGSYHIEMGLQGSEELVWTSSEIGPTNTMWDGTLSDGSHITAGSYWWQVAVTKSLGNYVEVIYTQPWDLLFNP